MFDTLVYILLGIAIACAAVAAYIIICVINLIMSIKSGNYSAKWNILTLIVRIIRRKIKEKTPNTAQIKTILGSAAAVIAKYAAITVGVILVIGLACGAFAFILNQFDRQIKSAVASVLILFDDEECICYAECTNDGSIDSKTAYELIYGPDEFNKLCSHMELTPAEMDGLPNGFNSYTYEGTYSEVDTSGYGTAQEFGEGLGIQSQNISNTVAEDTTSIDNLSSGSGSGEVSVSTTEQATPNEVSAAVLKRLQSLGYSDEACAGFMGNLDFESAGWQLNATYGSYHGLAQWGPGRFTRLCNIASSMGLAWTDLEPQLALIEEELSSSDRNYSKCSTYNIMSDCGSNDAVDFATFKVARFYEICIQGQNREQFDYRYSDLQKYKERYERAQKWYNTIKSGSTTASIASETARSAPNINFAERAETVSLNDVDPEGEIQYRWIDCKTGQQKSYFIVRHLNDQMLLDYKNVLRSTGVTRYDSKNRYNLTNDELREDLVKLFADYKVNGRNPNCTVCQNLGTATFGKFCHGAEHWTQDRVLHGSITLSRLLGISQNSAGGTTGGGATRNKMGSATGPYAIQLDDGTYYWYHQSSPYCGCIHCGANNSGGMWTEKLWGTASGHKFGKDGCAEYSLAIGLSNLLGREVTPDEVMSILGVTVSNTVYDTTTSAAISGRSINRDTAASMINSALGGEGIRMEKLGTLVNTDVATMISKIDSVLANGGIIWTSWDDKGTNGVSYVPWCGDGSRHFMCIRKTDGNRYYCFTSCRGKGASHAGKQGAIETMNYAWDKNLCVADIGVADNWSVWAIYGPVIQDNGGSGSGNGADITPITGTTLTYPEPNKDTFSAREINTNVTYNVTRTTNDFFSKESSYNYILGKWPTLGKRLKALDSGLINKNENQPLIYQTASGQKYYVGAMVDGFAHPGDVIRTDFADGSTVTMVIVDVKSLHDAKGAATQIDSSYGHGNILANKKQINLCALEFITGGNNSANVSLSSIPGNNSYAIKSQIIGTVSLK